MNVQHIASYTEFKTLCIPNETTEISKVFCCDLLSVAMGKASENCAWITVMGNRNALAVASLADVACIVLAEGATMDTACLEQAEKVGISIFQTELPVFEAGLLIYDQLRMDTINNRA